MKKAFLIVAMSVFGLTASLPVTGGSSVVFAQKKDRDEKKKNPPGPPVIRDKDKREKSKEPPRKDKRPS